MYPDPSGPSSPAGHRAPRSASRRPRRLSRALTVWGLLSLAAVTAVTLFGIASPGSSAPRPLRAATAAAHETLPAPAPTAPAAAGTAAAGTATAGTATAGTATAGTATAQDTDAAPEVVAHHPHADAGESEGDGAPRPADRQADQPAAPNPNCTLSVPAAPTSAAGLATPYRLTATHPGAGPCHEADAAQSAFVEAAIYDPQAHAVSIYHPVVVDGRDQPAVPPVGVTLPAGAVVGVWFGFNGDTLTLAGPGAQQCVNGLPGSPFGQFAYCNAGPFFAAASADTHLPIPDLGTGTDGLPCPTSRDFSVVDQDQSDNLATVYRVVNGRIAQDTAASSAGRALSNGSDEGLVAKAIDPALGCTPFEAPDLTNGGAPTQALALNELSAAAHQAAPAALVPVSDPMVQVNGHTSQRKTDLYRVGVDQPTLAANPGQSPSAYCADLARVAPKRLAVDAALLRAAPTPAAGSADLLAFLKDRLSTTYTNLGCRQAGAGQGPTK